MQVLLSLWVGDEYSFYSPKEPMELKIENYSTCCFLLDMRNEGFSL
jgi:hypothetical protein